MIFLLLRIRNFRFMRVWRWIWIHTTHSILYTYVLLLMYAIFQRGIFVAGLREEIVNSAEQVLKLIEMGEGLTFETNLRFYCSICFNWVNSDCMYIWNLLLSVNRHFGETNMNVRSSRSHTIFRMVLCLAVFSFIYIIYFFYNQSI